MAGAPARPGGSLAAWAVAARARGCPPCLPQLSHVCSHGSPSPAPPLLLAVPRLPHSTACRGGARGVILNQPMAHAPTLPAFLSAGADRNHTTGGGSADARRVSGGSSGRHEAGVAALKHFLGGPVGMPGTRAEAWMEGPRWRV